jgi:hypothetical protein
MSDLNQANPSSGSKGSRGSQRFTATAADKQAAFVLDREHEPDADVPRRVSFLSARPLLSNRARAVDLHDTRGLDCTGHKSDATREPVQLGIGHDSA